MALPVVPVDSPNEKQHRAVIATSLNELVKFYNTIQSARWTPVIRGSSTAGTYEIATNNSRYSRIGRRVFADVYIEMAAALTGGGVGGVQITGLPFEKAANTYPIGSVLLSGVDLAAGAHPVIAFNTEGASSTLVIQETNDNAANSVVAIGGIAANDLIFASICYETDDP